MNLKLLFYGIHKTRSFTHDVYYAYIYKTVYTVGCLGYFILNKWLTVQLHEVTEHF